MRPLSWYRRFKVLLFAVAGLSCGFAGCLADGDGGRPSSGDAAPQAPPGWPAIVWPEDNPYSAAKVELGRKLFFDARLSRDSAISCSWCHSERASFADNHHVPMSTGIFQRLTTRNPPTLINVAFGEIFTFDGAAASLEEQVLLPLFAENEMGMTEPVVEAMLSSDSSYVRMFREAFGAGAITLSDAAKALATYERTLISTRSPYDAWIGGDTGGLAPAERRGAALFTGKAGCAQCHVPPLFTDGDFHNIGLDSVTTDAGRARITGRVADEGKFKTPTLRNLFWTHPYMHDGRFVELREIVDHYNAGGAAHPNKDSRIRPLGLSFEEGEDLIAFLEALTDQHFVDEHAP